MLQTLEAIVDVLQSDPADTHVGALCTQDHVLSNVASRTAGIRANTENQLHSPVWSTNNMKNAKSKGLYVIYLSLSQTSTWRSATKRPLGIRKEDIHRTHWSCIASAVRSEASGVPKIPLLCPSTTCPEAIWGLCLETRNHQTGWNWRNLEIKSSIHP